jgi:hypothetical protein
VLLEDPSFFFFARMLFRGLVGVAFVGVDVVSLLFRDALWVLDLLTPGVMAVRIRRRCGALAFQVGNLLFDPLFCLFVSIKFLISLPVVQTSLSMPRSAKKWCEHCQQYVSQQRANEHRAFLFNPYTTASLANGSATVPDVTLDDDDGPLDNHESFTPGSNHLPDPAQLRNIRAWVEDVDEEDLMDVDDWTMRELDDEDDSEDDEEDFDWDEFVRRYRVAHGNLSPEDLLGAAFEQEALGGMFVL